ncbi:hypothetical protein GX51_08308 [Blastomyces parvus]|uniref:F-box domain-containing protein n=1 Tax=Blastomyces parvus TaxID=2060905 RepID=A0A2B7WF04_9EURO|nr:hypothetical protein GX51_08308 [Blastomyces parvus]
MSRSIAILDLPTEILHLIGQDLDTFSLIRLRSSCRGLRESMPSPTHRQLLEAECTEFGTQNDLYACKDCLRLRPRAKFGDKMVVKKRRKGEYTAADRFCVDCGINPRPGTTRYNRGDQIMIQKKPHGTCLRCRKFKPGALEDGQCHDCLPSRKPSGQILFDRGRQERARLRAEKAERRARRREIWGSSGDETDEIPSPTSSEQ